MEALDSMRAVPSPRTEEEALDHNPCDVVVVWRKDPPEGEDDGASGSADTLRGSDQHWEEELESVSARRGSSFLGYTVSGASCASSQGGGGQ